MATKKTQTTEVSKVPELQLPAEIMDDVFADAGLGNENLGKRDVLIPRLKIAQALSPQVKKTKPEYIEGCDEGSIFINGLNQLLGTHESLQEKPILIVPIHYERRFIEWVPRGQSGDGAGAPVNSDHDESILEQCKPGNRNRPTLPNGNEIIETPEHFVFVVSEDGDFQPAVFSMSGAQAKHSRAWNTLIRNLKVLNPSTGKRINPARFYGSYHMSTAPESNDDGDWMGTKLRYAGPIIAHESGEGTNIYLAAREFLDMIRSGEARAAVDHDAPDMPASEGQEKANEAI